MQLGKGARGVSVNGKTGATSYGAGLDGRWTVTFDLVRLPSGDLVIQAMHLEGTYAALERGGLNASVLSKVTLGAVRAYAALNSRKPQTPAPAAKSRRGRPARLPRSFYVTVAKRYRQLVNAGQGRTAPKLLAQEFGYGRPAMRSVLARCRGPKLALL